VAAVVELQREDLVARFEDGVVHRLVRLRAGVRLDVDVVGAPQLLRALDRQLLDLVGVLAAGVVARAGIALGVLVGEDAPLRLQYRLAHVVLARDHRERLLLSVALARQRVGDRRVDLPDVLVVHVETGARPRINPSVAVGKCRCRARRRPSAPTATGRDPGAKPSICRPDR